MAGTTPLVVANEPSTARGRLHAIVFGRSSRPVRFAAVGAVCAVVQLGILGALSTQGVAAGLANAAGLAVSAQLKFGLSQVFTWHDRKPDGKLGRALAERWATFHGLIALTTALNFVIFLGVEPMLPLLVAGAVGIGGAAVFNYLLNHYVTFGRYSPGALLASRTAARSATTRPADRE
jgi:putative flippase GtrA